MIMKPLSGGYPNRAHNLSALCTLLQNSLGRWRFLRPRWVNGHGLTQGAAQSLEHGLDDVVGVFSGQLVEVESRCGVADKAQHEFLHQLGGEGARLLCGQLHLIAQRVPAG